MSRKSQTRTFQSWVFFCYLTLGFVSWGATPEADTVISPAPAPVPQTARELYNAGSRQLQAGKLGDAEALLESSLDQQEDLVQPVALFNLGHVRFAQGTEALKKSPGGVAPQSRRATEAGDEGIRKATEALASSDVAQMVAAYWTGRGARQEMRAATDAVRRAMEAHGKTLAKWRQSLNDFRSAAELRPSDTNAVRNAEIVAQAIARLVDSMREMQQSAAGLSGRQTELKGLLAQLKGRIPGPSQTPGAPGEDGEEGEGGEGGDQPLPESLSGLEERSGSGGGLELNLSPEKAGELLNTLQADGKPLPLGQDGKSEMGKPQDRSQRVW